MIKHLDMGQGVTTGLATSWPKSSTPTGPRSLAFAPADPDSTTTSLFGPIQGTGGSTSIANSYEQLRKAGAAARAMLVAAAADEWKVPAAEITVDKGVVAHSASGKSSAFGRACRQGGSDAGAAAGDLKDPKDFKLIGKSVPRLDSADKDQRQGGLLNDIKRPGQLTAVVAHPPQFGGKVKSSMPRPPSRWPASSTCCRSRPVSPCSPRTPGRP